MTASTATAERSGVPAPKRSGSLQYQPGLDGIRALAVAAVLVYHGGFGFDPGAFFSVTMFFTLSGFLITSLLIGEHQHNGSISLKNFWSRRLRRLIPASWLTIALVIIAGAFGLWTNSQTRGLLGDVPAALGQVINWRLIITGQSYGNQFAAPSPLQHYWTLAIEEQFYLTLPVLVVVCGLIARRAKWSLRATVAGLAVLIIIGSVTTTLIVGNANSRAYYGTDTRAAELAVGVLLAAILVGRPPIRRFWYRTAAEVAGLAAVVFWVVTWATVGLNDSWVYPWGLLLTAVSTAVVILACVQRGWISAALGVSPLRALGRISYGLYLLHWPVARLLTAARTGLGPWPLFILQTVVSLAAAMLSYHYVELPIRRGRTIGFRRAATVCAALAAVMLIGNALVDDVPAAASFTTRHAVARQAPTRVLLVGDQLAGSLSTALAALPKDHFETKAAAAPDCGLAVGGYVQLQDGRVELDADRCGGVPALLKATDESFRPDVVVVWTGSRDVATRRLGTDDPWSVPGPTAASAATDQFLQAGMAEDLAALGAGGAKVIALTMPVSSSTRVPPPLPAPPPSTDHDVIVAQQTKDYAIALARRDAPAPVQAEMDPARVAEFNTLLGRAARTAHATVVDAAGSITKGGGTVSATGADPASATRIMKLVTSAARGTHRHVAPAKVAAPSAALPTAPAAAPRRTPGATLRVTVVGDSVGIGLANGLQSWGSTHGMEVSDRSAVGCPIARGGLYRAEGDTLSFPAECSWQLPDRFPAALTQTTPDVVVVVDGAWEVLDRLQPGSTEWQHLGEPGADRFLLAEMLRAIDLLGSDGARVVLVTSADVQHRNVQGYVVMPDSDPVRITRFNKVLREAAAMRPGVASVVDFGAWIRSQPGGQFADDVRIDGVHYLPAFDAAIGDWLGPRVAAVDGR